MKIPRSISNEIMMNLLPQPDWLSWYYEQAVAASKHCPIMRIDPILAEIK